MLLKRLKFNRFVTGHSFGGATTVLSLSLDPRFVLGIALDAWLFPVKNENLSGNKKPIMFVSTGSDDFFFIALIFF